MAYPNKPSSAPAIPFNSVGKSKNLNDIFSAIAVEKLLALKTDGTYDNNFSIGDNALNSLVNEINIRQGSTIKEYDSTGVNLLRTLTLGSATNLAQGFRFLDESIKISNNATNPLTQIDISPGVMSPDDGTEEVRLSTSLTKSTANDFDNGGLLPNGTVLQTNTIYYVFVIYSTDSNLVNFYADTSKTNPTLPTSPNVYDKKQYRGAFYVDGNGNIATGSYIYSKYGLCHFTYTDGRLNLANTGLTTNWFRIPVDVPNGAVGSFQSFITSVTPTGTSVSLFAKSTNANSTALGSQGSANNNFNSGGEFFRECPTSQLDVRVSSNLNNSSSVATNGWIDYET